MHQDSVRAREKWWYPALSVIYTVVLTFLLHHQRSEMMGGGLQLQGRKLSGLTDLWSGPHDMYSGFQEIS